MSPKKKTFSPLALIPLGVALVLAPLMLPRAAQPTTIPLPIADMRVVRAIERADDERAARTEAQRLPDDARVLGQGFRDFNLLSMGAAAPPGSATDPSRVRRDIDDALRIVLASPNGLDVVLALRSVQLARFLDAVAAFERTGLSRAPESSKELDELGGSFVRSLHNAGWERDHRIVMDEHVRRVAFKIAWNAVIQAQRPELEPTLDEQRVLYAFYLDHPHADGALRASLDARRAAAKTPKDCEVLDAGEGLAADAWRLDKIDKLAKIDPSYPAGYAKGVALFRLTRYDESARELQAWVEQHPDGAYALRARYHLRAAILAKR